MLIGGTCDVKLLVYAFHVGEHDHGPSLPPDFDEPALNDVGGAQPPPEVTRQLRCFRHFRIASACFG